jgi:hypothetical protein
MTEAPGDGKLAIPNLHCQTQRGATISQSDDMFEAVADPVGDDGGRLNLGLRSSTPSMIFEDKFLRTP